MKQTWWTSNIIADHHRFKFMFLSTYKFILLLLDGRTKTFSTESPESFLGLIFRSRAPFAAFRRCTETKLLQAQTDSSYNITSILLEKISVENAERGEKLCLSLDILRNTALVVCNIATKFHRKETLLGPLDHPLLRVEQKQFVTTELNTL